MGNLLCCLRSAPSPQDDDLNKKLNTSHEGQTERVVEVHTPPIQAKKAEENQGKIQKLEEESKSEEPLQKIEEPAPLEKEEKAKKSVPLEKQETTETVMQPQKSLERRETNESGGKSNSPYKNWSKKKAQIKETNSIDRHVSTKGEKMINNYCILNTLGEGSFGKVKLCVKKLMEREKKFAAKVFKKSKLRRKREMIRDKDGKLSYKDALQGVLNEIAVMKKLDHPNVIRLHEVLDDDEKEKLYMILDFAPHGQLIEWDDEEGKFFYNNPDTIGFLSEEKLRQIFRQCIIGLHYLHVNKIIHRDIKPQNILFDEEDRPKIADFGQSALFENEDKLQSTEGTYWFMSPEMLDPNNKEVQGKPTDVWSLGITFYAFIFLKVPFFGNNLLEIIESIKTQELTFPEDHEISEGLKNLLKKMIDKNPETRATIENLMFDEWLNLNEEPLEIQMKHIEAIVFNEVALDDVIIPLERIAFMKSVVKVMKRKTVDGTKKRSTANLHEQEHNDDHEHENEQVHEPEVVAEEKKE